MPDSDLSLDEVTEHLALRGAPVEDIVSLAAGLEEVVIGQVESVERHPNADRLWLCSVDTGSGSAQVVCGAPVVKEGAFYPFIAAGSVLPGDVKIKKSKIRGVHSEGMLCSERELELGPDHEGIMELQGEYEVGASFTEAMALDDTLLDVEVTPNRGDLLSHLGIAREVAPGGVSGIVLPTIPDAPEFDFSLESAPDKVQSGDVSIRIDDPDLCNRYLGAVIRGVQIGPSPEWLASRLRSAGARPINNVVDATNYVLLEMGQPLHAFDLSKLGGQAIVVRTAAKGETLRTLDGEDRKLASDMLCICDASDPVAVAGVMGGADSEVGETSTDILLECALFAPKSIRSTRKALDMSTDASYRFERGVDPAGMEAALRRAVEVILATAGGTVESVALDVCPRPFQPPTVSLRPSRVEHLLGVPFENMALTDLLVPLGYQVQEGGEDTLEVTVPGYRSYDTLREVDLIEEVARTHGFDRFPEELGAYRPGTVSDHLLFTLEDELRDLLVGRGFFEAQLPAFSPPDEGEVEVDNPVSLEESHLRRSLLPGLLRRVEYNFARGARSIRLFELGTVFFQGEGEGVGPREETHLGVVLTGERAPSHWAGDATPADLWEIRGILESTVALASLEEVTIVPGVDDRGLLGDDGAFLVEGLDGKSLGRGGRVKGDVIDAPAWAGEVYAVEITLPGDPKQRPEAVFQPLPPFPGVERDLALVVPDSTPAGSVDEVITSCRAKHLVEVAVFDLYEGEGVPEGHRSIAYRLRFQSPERTLTDKDVDRSVGKIVQRLEEELGVKPR
jgi:phenylalanyl-tRNA synthetase beta chain